MPETSMYLCASGVWGLQLAVAKQGSRYAAECPCWAEGCAAGALASGLGPAAHGAGSGQGGQQAQAGQQAPAVVRQGSRFAVECKRLQSNICVPTPFAHLCASKAWGLQLTLQALPRQGSRYKKACNSVHLRFCLPEPGMHLCYGPPVFLPSRTGHARPHIARSHMHEVSAGEAQVSRLQAAGTESPVCIQVCFRAVSHTSNSARLPDLFCSHTVYLVLRPTYIQRSTASAFLTQLFAAPLNVVPTSPTALAASTAFAAVPTMAGRGPFALGPQAAGDPQLAAGAHQPAKRGRRLSAQFAPGGSHLMGHTCKVTHFCIHTMAGRGPFALGPLAAGDNQLAAGAHKPAKRGRRLSAQFAAGR